MVYLIISWIFKNCGHFSRMLDGQKLWLWSENARSFLAYIFLYKIRMSVLCLNRVEIFSISLSERMWWRVKQLNIIIRVIISCICSWYQLTQQLQVGQVGVPDSQLLGIFTIIFYVECISSSCLLILSEQLRTFVSKYFWQELLTYILNKINMRNFVKYSPLSSDYIESYKS